MSEKILNTRIQLKGDSFKNWTKYNPVLKLNELAVVRIDSDDTTPLGSGISGIYFKVGDGSKTFSQLGFSGGIDGRVIAEAISKETLVATITDTITHAGIATDKTVQALAGKVTTVEGKITTLEGLVGTKAVATQIAEAIEALKLSDTYDAKGAANQALTDAKSYTDTEVEAAKPSIYTGTNFDTVVAGIDAVKKGDVVVISTTLAEGKVEKSAYQYDGTQWVACDGMVDADKVILKEDITMAGNYTTVGNLTKTQSGTATFATAGKSVAEAFTEIFSKRLQPSITGNPAVSLTFSKAGSYEVGTEVTPSYSATLSAGSYTYGPATGITATSWEVTDTKSNSATTATGSFDKFTVGDGENYTITAKATHGAGAIAKDNLGSDSNPVVQIAAGNKSKTSSAVTGYRSFFYGVLDTSTAEAPLTSAIVRGMTNGGAYNSSKTFTINANATAKRIVIAVPSASTRSGLSSVILTSAMNTPVTGSYVKTAAAVQVEGVNGYTAVDYDVWVYEPAAIDAGEVHKVTLG